MKKNISLMFAITLLAGCVQVSGTKSATGDLKVNTHRFMWASQNIDFSVKDEKGFITQLKVEKSNADTATAAAVTEAAVRAAVNSAAPSPATATNLVK